MSAAERTALVGRVVDVVRDHAGAVVWVELSEDERALARAVGDELADELVVDT